MYIIEGNIGAGKSTFLKLIEQKLPNIAVALEPIHNWQGTVYGQSLLSNFYQQPKRWAYTMETLTMMCRVREHLQEQALKNPNKIIERSIYSGHYCFAQNGYDQGFLTKTEWHSYLDWFNFLIPKRCKAPLAFIYLRVDPEIAYERLKKRNRLAEKGITLQYLKQIHAKHESFLINDKKLLPSIQLTPVLILDCNEEFEANNAKFTEHCQKVQQLMATTQQTYTAARVDWQILRQTQETSDMNL